MPKKLSQDKLLHLDYAKKCQKRVTYYLNGPSLYKHSGAGTFQFKMFGRVIFFHLKSFGKRISILLELEVSEAA